MINRKTVSQCISSDYCKGYNDAVDAMQIEFQEFRDWVKWQMKYNREESNKFVTIGCPDFEQARYEDMADAFEECLDQLSEMGE